MSLLLPLFQQYLLPFSAGLTIDIDHRHGIDISIILHDLITQLLVILPYGKENITLSSSSPALTSAVPLLRYTEQ